MPLDPFLSSVRRTALPNGLTLLTRHAPGSGVVAIQTWVRAGYFHEPDEVAGMAHLFEHMFFKGSARFPGPEEIARHVSGLGGSTNAGTIYDSTNYYFVLPAEGFERGAEIQADAVLNPLFDERELKKEAEVVIEESNRKLDNPPALAVERMYALAFTTHRMRRWRIGSNVVLRNIRRDALVRFFETLYRPANMIVAVAGDVDHERAIATIERTFGAIPPGTVTKEGGPAEPPQREFRFGQETGDVSQSHSVMGWHTPGEGAAEEEALELLAAVLGDGRSSRLYTEVVRKKGAASIAAWHSTFEDVGMFTIRAAFEDGKIAEVESGILREVERMKRFGPTEHELARARNGIEAAAMLELEDVLGQAQALAWWESRGGYERMARRIRVLGEITPARVKEVAKRHLTVENLTLFRYRPAEAPRTERALVLPLVVAAMADPNLDRVEEAEVPAPRPAPRAAVSPRPLQRFVLPNGMTLFVLERPGTTSVAVDVLFAGGRVSETSADAGITQLTSRVVRRGSLTRTGERIDREIEFLGSSFGLTVEEDYFGVSLSVVRERLRPAVELLADFLLHPSFPEEAVAQERALQVAAIRRSWDSTGERPFQLFAEAFYGSHPYALPAAGFEATVGNLSRADLQAWYQRHFVADAGLIVVAGDVHAEEIEELAEALFGGLPKSAGLKRAVPRFVPPAARRELVELREKKQSAVVVGFPTVPPQHPDWIPLRVLQDVASGLAGTFFAELRGRRSLAYTVFAGDSSSREAGAFVGYIASEAAKEEAAREGLIREMHRLAADGITPEELQRARSSLSGTTRIRLQTSAALASDLARSYLFGLGLDFRERFLDRVRGVTLEEARAVAKRYLSHDNYTVAVLRGTAG